MQGLGSTRGTVTLIVSPAVYKKQKNVREGGSFLINKYFAYRINRVIPSGVGRGTVTLIVFPAIYGKKKNARVRVNPRDRNLKRLTRNRRNKKERTRGRILPQKKKICCLSQQPGSHLCCRPRDHHLNRVSRNLQKKEDCTRGRICPPKRIRHFWGPSP